MAKGVKSAKKIKIAEPVLKVDTAELKLLLVDLENLVQGPGTVDDRQKVVDKLKDIINKFDAET